MKTLDLSNNNIQNFEGNKGMKKKIMNTNIYFVKVFRLWDNDKMTYLLIDLDLDGVPMLRKLEELYLQGNKFSNKIFNFSSSFERLKYVDLSGNELNGKIQIGGQLSHYLLYILHWKPQFH